MGNQNSAHKGIAIVKFAQISDGLIMKYRFADKPCSICHENVRIRERFVQCLEFGDWSEWWEYDMACEENARYIPSAPTHLFCGKCCAENKVSAFLKKNEKKLSDARERRKKRRCPHCKKIFNIWDERAIIEHE